MENKKINDRIEIIYSMMKQASIRYVDNGTEFIFFGIYAVLGIFTTYIGIELGFASIINNYFFIYWIGVPLIYFFARFKTFKKTKINNSNCFDIIIGMSWVVASINVIVIYFINNMIIVNNLSLQLYMALLSSTFATAFLISGYILTYGYILKISSIGWFLISIFSYYFVDEKLAPLVVGFGLLMFQIIPGLILKILYNKKVCNKSDTKSKLKGIKEAMKRNVNPYSKLKIYILIGCLVNCIFIIIFKEDIITKIIVLNSNIAGSLLILSFLRNNKFILKILAIFLWVFSLFYSYISNPIIVFYLFGISLFLITSIYIWFWFSKSRERNNDE